MTRLTNQTGKRPGGFSLIELMVVMAITVFLIALSAGSINEFVKANATEAGLTTVSSAMSTTRAHATRGLETGQVFDRTQFQGVALLFTPSDLRVVRHVARRPDGGRLEKGNGSALEDWQPAYREIPDVDYISMPKDAGVVGISRNGPDAVNGLLLFAPPFAIRFNPSGQLVSRRNDPMTGSTERIYYDGDYNEEYEVGSNRGDPGYGSASNYFPMEFDPTHDAYNPSAARDTDENKTRVPFEAIETVVGVIVYSEDRMEGAMLDEKIDPMDPDESWMRASESSGAIDPDGRDWLLQELEAGRARLMLFNRYTGAVMRESS